MKKKLLLPLLLVTSLFVSNEAMGTVTPIAGSVAPEVSTTDSSKWCTMMSSHLTESTRQNRFLKWDGTTLKTEQFATGIANDQLSEAYLWRLESVNDGTESHVYLVNYDGKRVFVPGLATAGDASEVSVASLARGVYIAHIDGKVIKFMK